MKTLAVFGGTFNPFHIGHEQMLKAVCELDWVDKVLLIPSKIPPHKEVIFLASDEHRLNMCRLIADKYKKVTVSDIEITREGKSYTVDTLSCISEMYPKHKLALCVGGDMITSFTSWKEYKNILASSELIAFSRFGTEKDDFYNEIDSLRSEGAKIYIMDTVVEDISSTFIRNNINDRSVCEKYIPQKVLDYIFEKKVYND